MGGSGVTADRQHDERCDWHKPMGSCGCGVGDGRSASVVEKYEDRLRNWNRYPAMGGWSYIRNTETEAIADAIEVLRYAQTLLRSLGRQATPARIDAALARLDALTTGPDSEAGGQA